MSQGDMSQIVVPQVDMSEADQHSHATLVPDVVDDRRGFLVGAAAAGAAAVGAHGIRLDDEGTRAEFEYAVAATWRHCERTDISWPAAQREMVRYATLAASSHNSQPWRFRLLERGIVVLPEPASGESAGDFDSHERFVSLGCAVENIVQAATAFGLRAVPSFDHDVGGIYVDFTIGAKVWTALFDAIPRRRTTHGDYDGRPVAPEHLRLFEAIGNGDSVRMLLFTESWQLDQIRELILASANACVDDAALVGEVTSWTRFSYGEALATRDGLCASSLSGPLVPTPGATVPFVRTLANEGLNRTQEREVRSSSGFAVFVSPEGDPAHWVEAGRCCQRFALQAAALGIRTAFMCRPPDGSAASAQFAAFLGMGGRPPDVVMRFGYGPGTLRSLRRPAEQFILSA